MDNQLDEMAEQFKTLEDLKIFSDAQAKTIISQSQKITKLENKVKELESSNPSTNALESTSDLLIGKDQNIIAKVQLAKLRELSLSRELTLDECRKAEILVKILNNKSKTESTNEIDKEMPLADVLKLVEDNNF